MKTIKNRSKHLALVFVLLILIQSCVAYGPPIMIEEATKQSQKTRVKYENDEIHRFLYVVEENDNYYGVEKENGEITKTQIDTNRIENVRTYSKSRSVTATIFTPIVLVGAIIGIAVVSYSGPTLSWSE